MSYPAGQAGGPPVCPRHPDRVSYVSCQRCGRPTCPECQRTAPVGVQCVDCVRQAERAMPTQRTVFGGRVRHGKPMVTMTLIALCLLVYLVDRVAPGVRSALWFVPAFGQIEPYRFLTAAFLHGGFLHLAVNMYALWIVGSVLEPALGRWRYTVLFLLSALGGSVGVLLLASPDAVSWITAVVGASGAVFGLFAAIGLVLRRLGRDATQILVLLVINAVLGFVITGISWQAHLGGFITGGLLAAAFVYAPKGRRAVTAVAASVVLLALLLALTVVKYSLI